MESSSTTSDARAQSDGQGYSFLGTIATTCGPARPPASSASTRTTAETDFNGKVNFDDHRRAERVCRGMTSVTPQWVAATARQPTDAVKLESQSRHLAGDNEYRPSASMI